DGAIDTAPGQPPAVAAERHALDAAGLGQVVQEPPRRGLPNLDGPVPTGRGQPLAVAAERPVYNPGRVPRFQDAEFLARGPVPDPDGAVPAARGEVPAVRAERHAEPPLAVTPKVANLLRGPDIPYPYELTLSRTHELILSRTHRQVAAVGA